MTFKLTIVGCGDAFGSGGRLQTGYHVDLGHHRFLIDCGATSLIGLDKLRLDPNAISTIFISHLHGDHYSGLVWWMMHAVYVAKRTVPLTVIGPPGVEARVLQTAELMFPGSTKIERRYPLIFRECRAGEPLTEGPVTVTAWEVSHPSGAPSHALRFEMGGKVLAFSGDTEWVEALIPVSAGADLFITECYAFDGPVRYHTSWQILQPNLPRITAKRILITHMNSSMLARLDEIGGSNILLAEDGLVVEI
ncbi:MAG: MBL fold metallo-hydrolase [Hyphomicrobium sp.]|nr:MBL fold metallo-hydrolase [Hyphomicrobium sp.]